MQNNKIVLWAAALLALVMLIFATTIRTGSVTGTVRPHNSATQVWIYSATDTFKNTIQDNVIEIPGVKAGVYTLVVEPNQGYKIQTRTGVKVADGEISNVGEITMEQKK